MSDTVSSIISLRKLLAALPRPLGFVPTMGYLHNGHLALAQRAKDECASVVASIFVNPTQFGPNEDFEAYPRDLPRDLALLESVGVDLVWTPKPEIMYPSGYQTYVTVENVTQLLEGDMRPGHFRGVTTVVAKLFNAVTPDKAYFGQKDAQQVVVIQRMVQDLNFPLEIVVCPTEREADGLALSSRNIYLTPEQRAAAPVLYRALQTAQAAYNQGERDAEKLRQFMRVTLDAESLAKPQYVSCADPRTLQELQTITDGALLSMAVYFGKTRLIDNIMVCDT